MREAEEIRKTPMLFTEWLVGSNDLVNKSWTLFKKKKTSLKSKFQTFILNPGM